MCSSASDGARKYSMQIELCEERGLIPCIMEQRKSAKFTLRSPGHTFANDPVAERPELSRTQLNTKPNSGFNLHEVDL